MQTSNSTGIDTRYTVESGTRGEPIKPLLKLIGGLLDKSLCLKPYSYAMTTNGILSKGTVHFYVETEEDVWSWAASGEFTSPTALVTLVGQPGQLRVEVAYPQVA